MSSIAHACNTDDIKTKSDVNVLPIGLCSLDLLPGGCRVILQYACIRRVFNGYLW